MPEVNMKIAKQASAEVQAALNVKNVTFKLAIRHLDEMSDICYPYIDPKNVKKS